MSSFRLKSRTTSSIELSARSNIETHKCIIRVLHQDSGISRCFRFDIDDYVGPVLRIIYDTFVDSGVHLSTISKYGLCYEQFSDANTKTRQFLHKKTEKLQTTIEGFHSFAGSVEALQARSTKTSRRRTIAAGAEDTRKIQNALRSGQVEDIQDMIGPTGVHIGSSVWLEINQPLRYYEIQTGCCIELRELPANQKRKSQMVIIPGISDLSESPKDQDIDQFAIMQVTDDDGRQVTLLVKRASNALEICQELLKKFNREESVENFSLSCIYNNEERNFKPDECPFEFVPNDQIDCLRFFFRHRNDETTSQNKQNALLIERDAEMVQEQISTAKTSKILDLSQLHFDINNLPNDFYQVDVDAVIACGCKLNDLPNLTHFTSLQILRAVNNCFQTFPLQIVQLTTLKELDLGNNRLEEFPDDFDQLNNLRELYFYVNHLKTINRAIDRMTSIQILNLASNFIEELPTFESLENLVQLELSYNCLTKLNEHFTRLTCLTDLNLANNQLNSIDNSLIQVETLRYLNLQANFIENLPSFEQFDHLTELYLNKNRLKQLNLNASLRSLKIVRVRENQLESILIDAPLLSLTEIDLCFNQLKELPQTISLLGNLEKFACAFNQLTILPDSLCSLKKLVQFDAKHNQLISLPNAIGNLKLSVLDVSHNQLTNLPNSICSLSKMWHVRMHANPMIELPTISKSDSISILDLYAGSCNLTRDVSHWISRVTTLRTLDLGYNNLQSIPTSIEKLQSLRILFLSGNQLNQLPTSICKLTGLAELYLAENQLKELPTNFHRLRSLKVIDLSCNSLSSAISICRFPLLEWLDISNNPLKSPPDISTCPILKVLIADQQVINLQSNLSRLCPNWQIESSPFLVSLSEMQGKRDSMEDFMSISARLGHRDGVHLFCVFDGHGSSIIAPSAGKFLTENLIRLNPQVQNAPNLIREAFQLTQKDLRTFDYAYKSGTTAIIALIIQQTLFIANIGDSRAVMSRNRIAQRLSCDHKPDDHAEIDRIRASGGFIGRESRVNGVLAVSRAFGDITLHPYVSCEPFVSSIPLSNEEEFLILACDGVWDVINDQMAVDIVHECKEPKYAASRLRSYAYMCGSTDNISVMVIFFQSPSLSTSKK